VLFHDSSSRGAARRQGQHRVSAVLEMGYPRPAPTCAENLLPSGVNFQEQIYTMASRGIMRQLCHLCN